jgi:C-terminal processing protease CtpA/Prc
LERKSGLKVGDLILSLAGRDVEDLDSWQVEQLLSGAESTSLNVEWQVGKGRKVAPLKLR